jgi:hypothetical protein
MKGFMKRGLYIAGGFLPLGLTFFVIAWRQKPVTNPVEVFALAVLFGSPSLGAFLMMYTAIRYERNPAPMILLAFVPFAFLWYYFERVRPGSHKTRSWGQIGNARSA